MAVLLKHADHPGSILVGKRIANHSDGNTFGTHTYAAPVRALGWARRPMPLRP